MDLDKRLTRRGFLIASAALIPACGSNSGWDFGPPYVTQGGRVFHFTDRGSLALYDVPELYDWAAEDAAVYLWKYGPGPEEVAAALRSYKVAVEDHFLFPTTASGTGYASGAISVPARTLIVALYTRQRNADGPPHTLFDWGGGNVQSGVIPKACPALAHELGHHFFGASFEHGWAPPIVNGRQLESMVPSPDWTGDCAFLS